MSLIGRKKKEISGKSVGQNVILMIDGQKYSKRFPEKKDREKVLGLVEAYNKRNSKAKEKEIIDLMATAKAKSKGEVTAQKKKSSKPKKAAAKKPTKKEIEAATKMLRDEGYTVSKRTARPTRREY